jgi:LmbE family N-acetylglucosaminyl deacetylase
LKGRTVLAVFAHPDDESLACGGTLARLSDAGARVVLLCASRGERGSGQAAPRPDPELAVRRTRELHAAAKILGVAELLIFDHADGNLRWADVPELHDEIVSAIRCFHPDVVISFGEDGLYWHLDHIGIHERTLTAVYSLGDAAPCLYYVTMPKGAMRQLWEAAALKGWVQPSEGIGGLAPDAFGAAARRPSLVVDVRPWISRKLAALRCHTSQMGKSNPLAWIDEDDVMPALGIEYFRRARPYVGVPLLEAMGRIVTGKARV